MNPNDARVSIDTARPESNRGPAAGTPDARQLPRDQEIAAELRHDIKDGILAPGQQLLPIDELRQHFRCGPQTVTAAYRQLEDEGLIVRRHRVGVFVAGAEPQAAFRTAFRRVAYALRNDVNSGTYKPGDRLPCIRELGSRFRAGSETVVRALRELKAEGVVEARGYKGYFVTSSPAMPHSAPQPSADEPRPTARAGRAIGPVGSGHAAASAGAGDEAGAGAAVQADQHAGGAADHRVEPSGCGGSSAGYGVRPAPAASGRPR